MYSKNLNTKILVIKNLNFKFSSTHKPFFENANIEFDTGKMHFIKGKNGIGKSVFFRILQGNITKTEILSTNITFENKQFNITAKNQIQPEYANKIHIVKQDFNAMIADQFSFNDNLKFANIGSYPIFSNLPTYKLFPDFLNKFQIDYDKPSYLLSGGQRQILAILMILQKPCKILLLDEPTSALDEQNANMVMDFLNELVTQTKLTALIISHDNELVEKYAHGDFYEIISNRATGTREIMYKTKQ